DETTQIVEAETQAVEPQNPSEDVPAKVDSEEKEKAAKKERKERKEPIVLVREPGKSLLPFSRVQKVVRADKDIPMVAKEAVFLISLATEEFIRRLSQYAQRTAERERRATVQHKDIATVVRREDEFLFLE
ncbi:histone-fold-containing protein, partial [Pluteus cervinus]